MLVRAWEVYKYDSNECVVFRTKKLAETQTVMKNVESISIATIDLSLYEVDKLNADKPVWV